MGRRRLSIAYIATVAVAMAALLQSATAQTAHVVGGATGWTIPPGATVYSAWAANNTFRVGDILVFNFQNGAHDVAKVTKANYDNCNTNNPLVLLSTGPANYTLNESGAHYFLCAFPGHCTAGQKLAINVTAATASTPTPAPQPSTTPAPQPSAPAPQPVSTPPTPASSPQPSSAPAPAPQAGSPTPISAPTPSPSPSPSPSGSSTTYIVGDSLGWTIPTGGASAYETWATGKTFVVGDILVFNYVTGTHDVAEVTKEDYQSCSTTNLLSNFTTGPTRITLNSTGEHSYICAFPGHCSAGQKLAINVTGSGSGSGSPSSSPSPSSSTTPSSPSPAGDNGTTTPATPGSSATSLGVASLSSATLLSFTVLAFLM